MVAIDISLQETLSTPSESSEPAPPPTRQSRRRRRLWPWLLPALAVVIGLTLVSPAGRHQWALSFVRQPTPYTTLSFRDPAALPTHVAVGAPVHLTFTVANHQGRRMDYPVILSSANVGEAGTITVLRRTAVTVRSGGQHTTSVTVQPACKAGSACEVQVSLPGHPETIDVVLDMSGPKG